MTVPLDKLHTAGACIETLPDGVRVAMDERPRGVDVVTLPFPGFPTGQATSRPRLLSAPPSASTQLGLVLVR